MIPGSSEQPFWDPPDGRVVIAKVHRKQINEVLKEYGMDPGGIFGAAFGRIPPGVGQPGIAVRRPPNTPSPISKIEISK